MYFKIYKKHLLAIKYSILNIITLILCAPLIDVSIKSMKAIFSRKEFLNDVLNSISFQKSLVNSLVLALSSSITATVLAVVISILLRHTSKHERRLYLTLSLLPFVIPPFIYSIACEKLMSPSGLIGHLFKSKIPVAGFLWTYLLEVLISTPLAVAVVSLGFLSIRREIIESAEMYMNRYYRLKNVYLPALRSWLLISTCLCFSHVYIDFDIPSITNYHVVSLEIFSIYSINFESSVANLLAFIVTLIPVVLILFASRFIGFLSHEMHAGGMFCKQVAPTRIKENWLINILLFGWVFIIVILPIMSLLLEVNFRRDFSIIFNNLGFEIVKSTAVSYILACLITILAFYVIHYLFEGQRSFTAIVCSLVFLPGSTIGLGLISLWNSMSFPASIFGIPLTLVLGYFFRFFPLALILAIIFKNMYPKSPIEMGYLYASPLQRLKQINIPIIGPSISVVFSIIFISILGEISITILLVKPGWTPISIRIFNLLHYAPMGAVSMLCLIIFILAVLFVVTTFRFSSKIAVED